jgi:hypothetical protein
MQDTECRKHGRGDRIQGARHGGMSTQAGCRVQDTGCRIQGIRDRIQGAWDEIASHIF